MPNEDQDNVHTEGAATPVPPGQRRRRLAIPVIAAAVALVIGAAGGAGAVKMMRPMPEMAPLAPVAISAMPGSSLVTIKGKVAEIYGNKFVLQDDSGKALVETGRAGEGGALVTRDEAVTVQGASTMASCMRATSFARTDEPKRCARRKVSRIDRLRISITGLDGP